MSGASKTRKTKLGKSLVSGWGKTLAEKRYAEVENKLGEMTNAQKTRKSWHGISGKNLDEAIKYHKVELASLKKQVQKEIAQIKKERQNAGNSLPLYLHTDAAQAAAYLEMHVNSLGVDLMTINGGKIYGPKQSGILFIKTGTQLMEGVR